MGTRTYDRTPERLLGCEEFVEAGRDDGHHRRRRQALIRSAMPTSVSQVGCPLVGLSRKLFEAEAGFAFKAPRQLAAVQPSEAGLQPDERMLDLRFRFLDRDAFSPAMSPNRSKHGC